MPQIAPNRRTCSKAVAVLAATAFALQPAASGADSPCDDFHVQFERFPYPEEAAPDEEVTATITAFRDNPTMNAECATTFIRKWKITEVWRDGEEVTSNWVDQQTGEGTRGQFEPEYIVLLAPKEEPSVNPLAKAELKAKLPEGEWSVKVAVTASWTSQPHPDCADCNCGDCPPKPDGQPGVSGSETVSFVVQQAPGNRPPNYEYPEKDGVKVLPLTLGYDEQAGNKIATLRASDADLPDDFLTHTILEGNQNLYEILQAEPGDGSGDRNKSIVLAFKTRANVATNPSQTIRLQVSDEAGETDELVIKLTLLPAVGILGDNRAWEGRDGKLSIDFYRVIPNSGPAEDTGLTVKAAVEWRGRGTVKAAEIEDIAPGSRSLLGNNSGVMTSSFAVGQHEKHNDIIVVSNDEREPLEMFLVYVKAVPGLYEVKDPINRMELPPLPGAPDRTPEWPLSGQWYYIFDGVVPIAGCYRGKADDGDEIVKQDDDGVDMNDVEQGALGNCHFVSVLKGMAHKHKGLIKNMVGGDGVQGPVVTLPGKPPRRIGFDFMNQGAHMSYLLGDFQCSDDNYTEIWPQMLEAAYAAEIGGWSKMKGGFTKDVWRMLTLGTSKTVQTAKKPSNQSIYEDISIAIDEGNATVFIGTKNDPDAVKPLAKNHCYYVEKVTEEAGKAQLKLRNPHYGGDASIVFLDKEDLKTKLGEYTLCYLPDEEPEP